MLAELIKGYTILIVYFIIGASSALALRRVISMPKEVFRKTLHIILLGSVFILTYAFTTWWTSAIAAIVFIIMVYPILLFGERLTNFSKLLIQRKSGEIKRSLIVAIYLIVNGISTIKASKNLVCFN